MAATVQPHGKSILVSTRALLLVPDNIKSNVKLNDKSPSKDKAKEADSKQMTESSDSHNPKKARSTGKRSTVLSCECEHHAQNQGVQALQQRQKPEQGR